MMTLDIWGDNVNCLSEKALKQLYSNCKGNAYSGGGGGKYRTALKNSGMDNKTIDEKVNRKEIDSSGVLMSHFQNVWIEQNGLCHTTGVELDEELLFTGGQDIMAPSVDRIDSTKGYLVGNIKFVLRGINRFKLNATDEDFEKVIKLVAISVCRKFNLTF